MGIPRPGTRPNIHSLGHRKGITDNRYHGTAAVPRQYVFPHVPPSPAFFPLLTWPFVRPPRPDRYPRTRKREAKSRGRCLADVYRKLDKDRDQ